MLWKKIPDKEKHGILLCTKKQQFVISNTIICISNAQKVIITIFIWRNFIDTLSVGVIYNGI